MSSVNLPSIIVYALYPGASASDVERDVTKILEDQFVTLPNYKSMDSISEDSVSFIQVYYRDDVDPYDQLQEIRYRISTLKNDLPSGLQGEPQALVGAATMLPAIIFTVDGGQDSAKVTQYVSDTLRPKINQIVGVSDITIDGGKQLQTMPLPMRTVPIRFLWNGTPVIQRSERPQTGYPSIWPFTIRISTTGN